MTATTILETLAREFSARPDHVQNAFEMLDAGLGPPFIGRFRRAQVGGMPESHIRRLARARTELEELDRRRGTILRLLERESSATPQTLDAIRACMDRFELEDLFIPHRRPEPEVQLALDRGLGALADELVRPLSREERAAFPGMKEHDEPSEEEDDARAERQRAPDEAGSDAPPPSAPEDPSHDAGVPRDAGVPPDAAHAPAAAVTASTSDLPGPDAAVAVEVAVAAPAVAGEHAEQPEHAEADESEEHAEAPAAAPTLDAPATSHAHVDVRSVINAHLARLCQPYVRPDKGIHTETEALSGALRILSDRLGRNARLRSTLRRLLAKQGVLSVRATVDESRLGRHKGLLKLRQPLRQIQGHRLLAIRQAQKERAVNTVITLDPALALPKVRAALGRHTHPAHEDVLHEIALQALQHRLLPMIEQDVRLDLKERADQEALRFLAQHLRQILFTAPLGRWRVAGLDVSAKGDWIVVALDEDGQPLGPEARIEVGEKDVAALGAELVAAIGPAESRAVAVGNGKGARAAVTKIRAALAAARHPVTVQIVNEAGLSSYANSELARNELPERPVPSRMAISLGRRLQDPMAEILKVDPRHLGLGSEQGLVSKANARRALLDTIESCTAHVGCDVNRAPASVLEHLPGLDRETARKIVARRAERPFANREDLRAEGLLSEARWTSAIAFLRVPNSTEPLDATALHPEQYPLVRRMLDSAGSSVEQGLGRPGITKGLRRGEFDVDEATWRDLMREIAFPGRDPRPRLYPPRLLEPDVDPVRLTKDRVVEGTVSNVASFGTFVDVGLPQDAMIHISEISDRYVRDARELLSIGQTIRARIVDASGPRLGLSLKNVPPIEREGGRGRPRHHEGAGEGQRGGGGGSGGRGGPRRPGGGGGGGRGREDREPRAQPNVRAAQSRRDGLGGVRGGKKPFGAGRRDGRGGPRDREDRGDRDERVRLDSIVTKKPAFTPFASFFKPKDEGEGEPTT